MRSLNVHNGLGTEKKLTCCCFDRLRITLFFPVFVEWHAFVLCLVLPNDSLLVPLQGAPNPKVIHSSKAVGEPPFFLGSAVLFAIKDAIFAARADEGHSEWFHLDNPATPERIRMACVDIITKKFADADYRPKLSV